MTITLIFLAVIMASIVGWLLRHSLGTEPWVASGAHDDPQSADRLGATPKKFGLVAFLAVITAFFALFVSAYALRMDLGDWRPLREPGLLWINTAVLIASSAFMQWAKIGAAQGRRGPMRWGVLGGMATAIAFMAGQWLAWRELIDAGLYVQTNPSYAFFYLFTALHGAHLLGGIWVMKKATLRVLGNAFDQSKTRQTIDLCAIYWHFLLVVWIGLYWLMLST